MLELQTLTDTQLRDAVVECERRVRVAQADQLAAIAEMARRSDVALADDPLQRQVIAQGNHDRYRFVADEVAVELGLSKVAASHRFHFAVELTGHQHTQQALATGRIDMPRAREIVEQLRLVEDLTFRPALEQAAVDYASTHTRPQLTAWLKRRIIITEPEAAERRRQQALAERRVAHYPGPDGTAHLWAQLDAADTAAIWRTIDIHAHTNEPDERTIDQRRADTLVDLILNRGNSQERPLPEIQVTVSAETLAGVSDQPGHLAGYGSITATHARQLAHADTRWRRILYDPTTGHVTDVAHRLAEPSYRPSTTLTRTVKARDTTCRFPGCRRSATGSGIDLDHSIPWPTGPTHATNLATLCRPHHYLKTHAGWRLEHHPEAVLQWTTPTGRTFNTRPTDHRPSEPPTESQAKRPDARGDPPF